MVYRSNLEALEARHRALEAELADKTRTRDEVARMLADARALARADEAGTVAAPQLRGRAALLAGALAVLTVTGIAVGRQIVARDRSAQLRLINRFSLIVDEGCRCADMACVRQVNDEMSRWAMEVRREEPAATFDDAGTRRLTLLGKRVASCMTRVVNSASDAVPSL